MQTIEGEIIQEPDFRYSRTGTPMLKLKIKDDYNDVNEVVVFGELTEEYWEILGQGNYILVKGYHHKEFENFVAQYIKRM